MKMPVSSYHGGELHVQNRIQYEYSAPPNLQIKREDANRSVITCHRAMWVQTRLAWYYIPPPGNKNYVCTASMIMTSYSPPRMIFVSSTTIYSSRNSGLVGRSRKVQYSLTRVLKNKTKNVYVASGIEPATINLFII